MFREYRIKSKKDSITVNSDKDGVKIGNPEESIYVPRDIWNLILRDYGEEE